MSERHRGPDAGHRTSESARRIALDDDKVGLGFEQRCHRGRDLADMGVRIGLAGAAEVDPIETGEIKLLKVQRWMLAGRDEPRRNAAGGESVGDG